MYEPQKLPLQSINKYFKTLYSYLLTLLSHFYNYVVERHTKNEDPDKVWYKESATIGDCFYF